MEVRTTKMNNKIVVYLGKGGQRDQAESFARRTDAPIQDKPGDYLTVRFDSKGVSLSGFGLTYQGNFVESMLHRVTNGRLQHEMLVKAAKSDKEGRKAIDATAGMGEDAFLLAAQGSCFSDRSGVVNIGIEGMMTIGAFTGAVMGLTTGNGWIAFLCAGLAGALFGLIHAFACISCHADQTIAGTAINFLGPGLALFLCKAMYSNSSDTPAMDPSCKLPKLFEGVFPTGSFWNNVLNVYAVAYLVFVLAFVCWFVFYKTKFGAHLRAVGE